MFKNKFFSCTTEHYNKLYTRYLKNPGKLLDMAGFDTGQEQSISGYADRDREDVYYNNAARLLKCIS